VLSQEGTHSFSESPGRLPPNLERNTPLRCGDVGLFFISVLLLALAFGFRELDSVVGELARKRRHFNHDVETPCGMSELMKIVPQLVKIRVPINANSCQS